MAASMQEASGTLWWQSLLFGFGVTWMGVGYPVLWSIRYYRLSPLAFLLMLLVYQVAPTMLLFLGERLIIRSRGLARALPLFRGILIVGVLLLLFSLYFSLGFLSVLFSEPARVVTSPSLLLRAAVEIGIPLAILGVALYLLVRLLLRRELARFVPQYVMVLGVLAFGWDGFYFYQNVPLSSGRESSGNPGNPSFFPGSSSFAGPVFILLFDGLGGQVLLKDGDIDGGRFPNFAALVRESALFTNATSNYVSTLSSVPSMLNGRFLSEGDPCDGTIGVCPTDVLKLLHERGYQVTAYYPELLLRCGDDLQCRGTPAWVQRHPFSFVARVGLWYLNNVLPARVAYFIPLRGYFEVGFSLHLPLPESFEGIVDEIAQSDTMGHVYYIHVTVPHDPLIFDRQGKRRLPPPRTAGYQQVERAYGEQVEYVDTLLGQFIARLKATGIYDRATIIVTGDHGPKWLDSVAERTTDGPIVEMSPGVALIIRQPGGRAEVSRVDYQHIDFKATLLDILGLPPEEGLPGVSAFASQRPNRDKVFFVSPPYLDTLIKWVYQPDTGQWLSVD